MQFEFRDPAFEKPANSTHLPIRKLARKFWEDGYILLENFFDDDLMEMVSRRVFTYYGLNPDYQHKADFLHRSLTEMVPRIFEDGEGMPIRSLYEDERVKRLSGAIIGPKWFEVYTMIMYYKQGSPGESWHQDSEPPLFSLNRLIYSHDISEKTGGAVHVVPGSHRLGIIPAGDAADPLGDSIPIYPSKGSLLLAHGNLWYAVSPIKNLYRFSINSRVNPTGTPINVNDVAVYRNFKYRFSTEEIVEERI